MAYGVDVWDQENLERALDRAEEVRAEREAAGQVEVEADDDAIGEWV